MKDDKKILCSLGGILIGCVALGVAAVFGVLWFLLEVANR